MLTVYRLVTPMGRTAEIIEHRPASDIIEDWLVKGYNVDIIREDKDNDDS
jgi:hypothetical protein